MSRRKKFLSICVVLLAASGLAALCGQSAVGQGPPKRTQWEYGELRWTRIGFAGALGGWVWSGPSGQAVAKNGKELAKKLTLELKPGQEDLAHLTPFMNALGSDGWELVSRTTVFEKGSETESVDIATFKRPK